MIINHHGNPVWASGNPTLGNESSFIELDEGSLKSLKGLSYFSQISYVSMKIRVKWPMAAFSTLFTSAYSNPSDTSWMVG
jgi:hypothetical protein